MAAEVTNVSTHGFWLLVEDREHFVSFKQFPWFRDAKISELLKVEMPNRHHLYWPDLDVDVAVESLEHPERYPLFSREQSNRPYRPTTIRRSSGRSRRRPARGRG